MCRHNNCDVLEEFIQIVEKTFSEYLVQTQNFHHLLWMSLNTKGTKLVLKYYLIIF